MDLGALRATVEREIDSYEYQVPKDSIGTAWPSNKVEDSLHKMRAALVDPYWAEVIMRDTFEQITATDAAPRRCAVVADDGQGTYLVFDPIESDFLLAQKQEQYLVSFGVCGDAVGCFLAR